MQLSSNLLALLILSCADITGSHRTKSYHGYKVLQIKDLTRNEVEYLQNLADIYYDEIDIWSYPSTMTPHMDIAVAPSQLEYVESVLVAINKPFEVIVNDLQKLIISESKQSFRKRWKRNSNGRFKVDAYHSYDEILAWTDQLQVEHPNLVQVVNMTTTYEGRPLRLIKIGSTSNSVPEKPAIWIDAGLHAREWIAPATAVYIIYSLVKLYNTDPLVRQIVDTYDWYILPVANPDGYEYTRSDDRLWRKTRSSHAHASNIPCKGVDANRNWGFHWGEVGAATKVPCSVIYAGPYPFSEPETVAIKTFIQQHKSHLQVYISLHAYGQLWLAPWGYTATKPENFLEQKRMAQQAIRKLKVTDDTDYRFGTIADLMYPASGTSIDYVQSLGVPYVFGLELRPEDEDDTYGFLYPPSFIIPTGRETFDAMVAIAEYLLAKRSATNPPLTNFVINSLSSEERSL